jgi:hypothetical protein
MKQSLELLDQIIEMAQAQAKELDQFNLQRHKASRTIGENAVVFYLKLIQLESQGTATQPHVTLQGKTFQVALGAAPYNVIWPEANLAFPRWRVTKQLPATLDVGKRARITQEGNSWFGIEGIIEQHYVNGDDCGDFDQIYYTIRADKNGELYPIRAEHCTLC